jgi:hypothetical protein
MNFLREHKAFFLRCPRFKNAASMIRRLRINSDFSEDDVSALTPLLVF